MEYQFRTNKTCDELSNDLSSILFKDRRTAFNSAWKRKIGDVFYGIVKNNHFTIKRLSFNSKIAPPCFTGNILENGSETFIVGWFNFNFTINYILYFAFLLFTIFLFWNQNYIFPLIIFEVIALMVYVLPMEYIRKKEEQKILTLIKGVI